MNTKVFLSDFFFFPFGQNITPEVGMIELCDEKGMEIINTEQRLRSGRVRYNISNRSFVNVKDGVNQ